jgi:DNA polymerase-3 subunit delta
MPSAHVSVEALLEHLPGVIGIGGPERALVVDARERVRNKVLSGPMRELNHDRVAAKGLLGGAVVERAETLPMLAPYRLVEVEDASLLPEDAVLAVQRYLERPASTSVVLLVLDTDQRGRLARMLLERGILVWFERIKERDLPRIVLSRARALSVSMTREATEVLSMCVAPDIGLVDRALEKLALVAVGRPVEADDVTRHVTDSSAENAFVLGQAIAVCDQKRALATLLGLEADRAAPLALLGIIAWQLRIVLRARELLDGDPRVNLGEALGLSGARLHVVVRGARMLPAASHARRLARLAAFDRACKRSVGSPFRWLERLVFELCDVRRGPG